MFDLTTHVNELMLSIKTRDGDVFVLGLTSWWRRWLNMQVWAVAVKKGDELFVSSPDGECIDRFGHMRVIDDPDKWPDVVCAAVAKWRLIGE
jgi:hypothetical protein